MVVRDEDDEVEEVSGLRAYQWEVITRLIGCNPSRGRGYISPMASPCSKSLTHSACVGRPTGSSLATTSLE